MEIKLSLIKLLLSKQLDKTINVKGEFKFNFPFFMPYIFSEESFYGLCIIELKVKFRSLSKEN